MNSVLQEILHGQWGKCEYIPLTAELSAQTELVNNLEKELKEIIRKMPEALDALKVLMEETDEETCLEACEYYKAGFRNGFFLAMDVFGHI